MSKAKHNCTCNHENVSYCKTCKVCHCADCNQEWRVSGPYNPYYWGQGLQTTGTVYTNGLNTPQLGNTILYKGTTSVGEPTNEFKTPDNQYNTQCKHTV